MKETTLDDYRYINVEHEWWECHYEYWLEELEKKGYSDVEIQFSGFHSQGDGASFTGFVRSDEVCKFMELHGLAEKYPNVYAIAGQGYVHLTLDRISSRYAHAFTVEPDGELEEVIELEDGADLRDIALYRIYESARAEWVNFINDYSVLSHKYMDKIYDDLRNDFDYLTSDEAVRETLNMNNIAA